MTKNIWLSTVLLSLLATTCTSPTPSPTKQSPSQGETPNETPASPVTANTLPPVWTPTNTLPPSLTPTITSTATIGPTRTPRPTRPPSDEIVREDGTRVSLSSATLLLSDLPADYHQLPLDDYFDNALLIQDEDMEIATFAAFADESEEVVVMSMTFVFPDEEDLREFDDSLSDLPEEFAGSDELTDFPEEMGIDMSLEIMEGFKTIGNNSIAFRMSIGLDTESIVYEIVMFRRGPVGASVFVMALGELPQEPRLAELATVLDQRILAVFQD